jgi:Holliday junction resolvasome RuvABC endonuclease subunit
MLGLFVIRLSIHTLNDMDILMIYAGIDFSYGGPAMAIYNDDKPFVFDNINFYALTKTQKYQGDFGNMLIHALPEFESNEERFFKINKWAEFILLEEKVEKVQLEGYAMGGVGKIFQIAENTALLKQTLWKHGIVFETPAPTQVKKAFTGKGNAKKEQMIEKFIEITGKDLSILLASSRYMKPIDDICDAYALLTMHPGLH